MITKNRRLAIILELVNAHAPNSQGKLLKLLHERGFPITQTTLSRDIKQLKISKMPDDRGNYIYMAPTQGALHSNRFIIKEKTPPLSRRGFQSFEFSYQFGVIKTRHGFASEIALDINRHASTAIMCAISNEDAILIVPRENVTKQDILDALVKIIPGFTGES